LSEESGISKREKKRGEPSLSRHPSLGRTTGREGGELMGLKRGKKGATLKVSEEALV